MKSYPSITRFESHKHLNFVGHTFSKIDGSNLRFEWEPKRGWFRFGSRRRLLTEANETFGMAWQLFLNSLSDSIEKKARRFKWPGVIAFAEFWGDNSCGGFHDDTDKKRLRLIDISVYKRGLMEPSEFVKQFDSEFELGYLGEKTWDETFVDAVRDSKLPGMSLEGVVGKVGTGAKRKSLKLKSKAWNEKVVRKFGHEEGQKIILS